MVSTMQRADNNGSSQGCCFTASCLTRSKRTTALHLETVWRQREKARAHPCW